MTSSKKKVKPEDEAFDYINKIIIIGDSGVGKSNILIRYSEDKFVENYMMTIGINYRYKVAVIDGIRIKLQVWDTAGQDKYKTITQNYYRNSDGVLIVFSIDSRDSFYSVRILCLIQKIGLKIYLSRRRIQSKKYQWAAKWIYLIIDKFQSSKRKNQQIVIHYLTCNAVPRVESQSTKCSLNWAT